MKRLFLFLIPLFFLLIGQADAQILSGMMKGQAAACTGSKLVDKQPATSDGRNDYRYMATKISVSSSTTITGYTALTCQNGGSGNTWVELWTDDGGSPSKPLALVTGTDSVPINGNTLNACPDTTATTFVLTVPKSGVTTNPAWIVLRLPADVVANYKASTGDRVCQGNDGSTWSCFDDYVFNSALYGCQP